MARSGSNLAPPPYTRFQDTPPCYDPEKALAEFNALSSDQKSRVSIGISQAASQTDALPYFKDAADAAAKAAEEIDTMFITLTSKLVSLEGTQKFQADFKVMKEHYRSVVSESRDLAIGIAQYAESFDSVVVKFCADSRLTVERRKEKINQYIADCDKTKTAAEGILVKFGDLKEEFAKFVGSFSTWAKEREEADQEKIKQLYKEITDIDDSLDAIESAMRVIGSSLVVTLPTTTMLALLFPPAAPWIMTVGLSLAGVELASLAGLAIARTALLNDKRKKERAVADLQSEISKIKATRTQLEQDGQAALLIFTTNIDALSRIWVQTRNDAQEIRKWLEEGASSADTPVYMKQALEHSVQVYTTMAQYLKDYANGVTTAVKNFKA
ncbi:uncharacterized protein C8Q71DRAFT_572436 [Rhodofomes roseus]|uniref:Uncharacterized protein n=1 Tax=Rhodofomes roseus TaxID=34475 RepID=A0ABQ8KJ33_9APHY|nr:uncharacterized protein C8Q71DRAFT_572436 [Rhodofomes roseus]KAH9838007.1 hypothetical protein C8Q71DRAFT_572436 [Rhodofomes roseus]